MRRPPSLLPFDFLILPSPLGLSSLDDYLVDENPRVAASARMPRRELAVTFGSDSDVARPLRINRAAELFRQRLGRVVGHVRGDGERVCEVLAVRRERELDAPRKKNPRAHVLKEARAELRDGLVTAKVNDGLEVLPLITLPRPRVEAARAAHAVNQGLVA